MNHSDHVNLLRGGVLLDASGAASKPAAGQPAGRVWADFGSGGGAFTLALADLLGSSGEIYSVDIDAGALEQQKRAMRRFPQVTVHYITADITRPLDLPPLDGVVMANALHFQRPAAQEGVVRSIKTYLRPGGRLVLVEYNVDRGNPWVPYPLSFGTWEAMASRSGFAHTRLLATRPSSFLTEIYSALSW